MYKESSNAQQVCIADTTLLWAVGSMKFIQVPFSNNIYCLTTGTVLRNVCSKNSLAYIEGTVVGPGCHYDL